MVQVPTAHSRCQGLVHTFVTLGSQRSTVTSKRITVRHLASSSSRGAQDHTAKSRWNQQHTVVCVLLVWFYLDFASWVPRSHVCLIHAMSIACYTCDLGMDIEITRQPPIDGHKTRMTIDCILRLSCGPTLGLTGRKLGPDHTA